MSSNQYMEFNFDDVLGQVVPYTPTNQVQSVPLSERDKAFLQTIGRHVPNPANPDEMILEKGHSSWAPFIAGGLVARPMAVLESEKRASAQKYIREVLGFPNANIYTKKAGKDGTKNPALWCFTNPSTGPRTRSKSA